MFGDRVAPAGLLLERGQLPQVPAGGLDAADDQPHALGPALTSVQPGQLGDEVALLDLAVLSQGGFPGGFGEAGDGAFVLGRDRPADGVADRAPRGVQRLKALEQAVRGTGAVDPHQDLGLRGAGYLRECGIQHPQVIGDGVRAGVAFPQLHRQALVGVGQPRGQRVEAEGALERAGGALFPGGRGDDRGVHVEHDPALEMPPRDGQIREAAWPQVQQRPDVVTHPLSYLRDLCAPRLVRRGQQPVQRGVRHCRSEQGAVVELELLGLQQIRGAERDCDDEADERGGPVPPRRGRARWQHSRQCVGQADAVGELAQQHRPGMPDQPFPVGRHRQTAVPPCTLAHQKGALTPAPDSI